MSVGSADFHKAIVNVWEATNLEWEHKQLWTEAERAEDSALLEQGQDRRGIPFPYTVAEGPAQRVVTRMSGATTTSKYHTRGQPWVFRVYAKESGSKTAKQIAADIAEKIMMAYGGHPTEAPHELTLDNGSVHYMQYQTDYPVAEDDDIYQHVVSYEALLDVPVEVG